MSFSSSRFSQHYQWHAGRLQSLSLNGHPALSFGYSKAGLETVRQSAEGFEHRKEYNQRGQLIAHQTGSSSFLANLENQTPSAEHQGLRRRREYAYDPAGQLTKVSDRIHGERRIAYDHSGRILSNEIQLGTQRITEQFSYDRNGQVSSAEQIEQAHSQIDGSAPPERRLALHHSRNKAGYIEQRGAMRCHYDNAGRLNKTVDPRDGFATPIETHYEWDLFDRLKAIKRQSGEHWQYRYDALGRRIEKRRLDNPNPNRSNPQIGTRFLWIGDNISQSATLYQDDSLKQQTQYAYELGSFRALAQIKQLEG